MTIVIHPKHLLDVRYESLMEQTQYGLTYQSHGQQVSNRRSLYSRVAAHISIRIGVAWNYTTERCEYTITVQIRDARYNISI